MPGWADQLFGKALIGMGLDVSGSEVVGYLLGLGVVLLCILALGLLVQPGCSPCCWRA
jgi:hypothetical protein